MSRDPAWVAGATLLALAATAVAAWSAVLGDSAACGLVAAAPAALVLVSKRPVASALVALVAWLPAAALLAGVPPGALRPEAGPALLAGLGDLLYPDVGGAGQGPWPLAVGVALIGAAMIIAAALARHSSGAAFAVAAAPWATAVAVAGADVPVWQGATVLAAGLLSHAWPRTSARAALGLTLLVALPAGIAAGAVASPERWLEVPSLPGSGDGSFRALDTEPTFKPIADGRDGSVMLEIRADEPALWRMQALDVFDGRTWRASTKAPQLPEPGAERTEVEVRVRGLRNSLAVAPGRVDRVAAPAGARTAGEAWELQPAPGAGDTYRVVSSVVRADARRLRRAPRPLTRGVGAYTRLGWTGPRTSGTGVRPWFWPPLPNVTLDMFTLGQPAGSHIQVRPFGRPPSRRAERALASSGYDRVAVLARRLAVGARTQWDVVKRVRSYLVGGHRFRYTTDVAPPGDFPLSDFLLRTHAGYCQHFAGAAALLLRMAGVPARMVTGFATGQRTKRGFVVRDDDAHAWIEVYFEGVGWVPFDVTPAADAPVARGPDSVATTPGPGGPLAAVAVAVLAAVALAGCGLGRRTTLEDALARLAARTGTPVRPSTTLAELRGELARSVGAHTSALAVEAERARFGPGAQRRFLFPRARAARALVRDAGLGRAVWLVLRVRARVSRARPAHRAPRTPGSAP